MRILNVGKKRGEHLRLGGFRILEGMISNSHIPVRAYDNILILTEFYGQLIVSHEVLRKCSYNWRSNPFEFFSEVVSILFTPKT